MAAVKSPFDRTRKEARATAEGVIRSFEKEVSISSPDLAAECAKARKAVNDARDRWKDAGSSKKGPEFADLLAAIIFSKIVCP